MDYTIDEKRIYANDADGNLLAEITFPTIDGISTINHTYVHESLRGQGIAEELVKLAIDKIQKEGHKINATCRYAVLWLQRHPEYLKNVRN